MPGSATPSMPPPRPRGDGDPRPPRRRPPGAARGPAVASVYAEFVHFLDAKAALSETEQALLNRLLDYGPHLPPGEQHGRPQRHAPPPGALAAPAQPAAGLWPAPAPGRAARQPAARRPAPGHPLALVLQGHG